MTLADLMFWPVDEELVIDTQMPDQVGHDEMNVIPGSTSSVIPGLTGNLTTDDVVDFALDHNPAVQIASWQQQNKRTPSGSLG